MKVSEILKVKGNILYTVKPATRDAGCGGHDG
jgi:hypothetical protein